MSLPSRTPSAPPSEFVSIHLNARLQPGHRAKLYEAPLQGLLDTEAPGSSIVGGGTASELGVGQISCDIEVEIMGDVDALITAVVDVLESAGAPVGSSLQYGSGRVDFGRTKGLALWLDGTSLPPEVYETCDVNDLIGSLFRALPRGATMQSWWEGPTGTSLYFYGPDSDALREVLLTAPTLSMLAVGSRVDAIT